MINFKSKIYIAGHNGLVGSAIVRKLKQKGYNNLISRSKKKLDLKNQKNQPRTIKPKRKKRVIVNP